ncbi:MAG: DUF1573 domain-containing protein [Cytophagales bacterium]|nr:MAG: DUF1573 domain-containing protein [Cytophagales bacterium]
MKDTIPLEIKNIGLPINTVNADFAAYPVNDSTLFFSSLRKSEIVVEKNKNAQDYKVQLLMISSRKDTFNSASIKNIIQDSIDPIANGSYNHNFSKFYFTKCPQGNDCKIWVKETINSKDTIYQLPKPINQEGFTSTQPYVAFEGAKEILYFASNIPKGIGKFDLWKATIEKNEYTELQNLQKPINSIDDELCPFYDTTQKQLYFSSNWHEGLGGFDIFYSKKENNLWQKPTNLGYPINSSANELYFFHYPSKNITYLTSNRIGAITEKSATCCNDIWYYQLPSQEPSKEILRVDSSFTLLKQFTPIPLYFHNDEPNPKSIDTTTSITYEITFQSYKNKFNDYLKINKVHPKEPQENNPIAEFLTNEVESSWKKLEQFTHQIYQQLNKGKRLEVTIKGYASPLANTDYNIKLTKRRIASLDQYFRTYQSGVLIPYLEDTAKNKGYLHLIKIPFGEYKAGNHVIDDINNPDYSIYSLAAAKERKIEIINVELSHEDTLHSRIKFNTEIHDFGAIANNDILSFIFRLSNKGNYPLEILRIDNNNSNVSIEYDPKPVLPNQQIEIKVLLTPELTIGKKIIHFQLYTTAKNSFKELTLTYEKIR